MRFGATLAVCVGLSLTAAGCDQADRNYFKKGIGSELNSEDIATATVTQNDYVEDVCRQAGLVPQRDGKLVTCGDPYNPVTWRLFVQAGMNDIDQRCDAYLSWLDYVRRGKEPTIRVLADAQTATTIIMERSGIGAGPIAIAAAAFGFASNTFTNVTSRLILEADRTTVQTVVLTHQKEYREALFGSVDNKTAVVIASRPAAIYALRSYLRLCMPMTIETQINNIVATFSRGGPDALRTEPLISAATVGVATITNVNAPIPAGPKASPPSPDRKGPIEGRLPKSAIAGYQEALCVSPANGVMGVQTRGAISEYLKLHHKRDTSAELERETTGLLQDVVDGVGSCRSRFLMNVFEVVKFAEPTDSVRKIKALQTDLNKALKDGGSQTQLKINGEFTSDAKLTDPTRDAIAEVRKIRRPKDPSVQNVKDAKNRQLDAAFVSDIAP